LITDSSDRRAQGHHQPSNVAHIVDERHHNLLHYIWPCISIESLKAETIYIINYIDKRFS